MNKGTKRQDKRCRAKHGHDCWDVGYWIDEYDPEFAECTCFKDGRSSVVMTGEA